MCTWASSNDVKAFSSQSKSTWNENSTASTESEPGELVEYARWITGITMLLFALVLSATMGIIQEQLYREHGKYPREALYYMVGLHNWPKTIKP